MHEFFALDTWHLPGRGNVYAVTNPIECTDFTHLIDQDVVINGEVRKCIGVERFAHGPPWRKGENIALLVEFKESENG